MDSHTHRDHKENRTIQKSFNNLNKDYSERLMISDGFHTKKNSQISLNFRNFFDKNFYQNQNQNNNTNINTNTQEKKTNFIYSNKQRIKNLELNKSVKNNYPPKLQNEKKFKFTKNYISPTIIDSNNISKSNQKYLKDNDNYANTQSKRNSKSVKTGSENLSLSKNPLKILQNSQNNNVNNSMKFEGNYNNISINYNNSNNNYNNNSVVKNPNLNYLNINSNYDNDSFLYKSNNGIFQKNTDLNFTSKYTDGNSTLKDTINVYDVNKKVLFIIKSLV